MEFDFNNAPEQRDNDVIPKGTIVIAQLRIRPGDAGEDGLLTHSQKGDCEGLDCELTVVEGKHFKAKLYPWLLLSGTTDGQMDMAHSNTGTLRAIIDSANGLKRGDVSEAAKKIRASFSDLRKFDGVRFMLKVGVREAKDSYPAKNTIQLVITPDMKEWHPIKQVEQPTPAETTAASKIIVKPDWAQ
jgi:hypothetical protein